MENRFEETIELFINNTNKTSLVLIFLCAANNSFAQAAGAWVAAETSNTIW